MSTLALLNVATYIHGHDFTGDSNEAQVQMERVALDRSNFRSNGWTELQGGLRSVQFEQKGFWQAGAGQVDPAVFDDLGVVGRVHTVAPSEVPGEVAYLWRGGSFQVNLFDASVGEMAPFAVTSHGTSSEGVVRGKLAAAPVDLTGVAVVTSATGQLGQILELSAPTATQAVYASLHVLGTPGTTVTADLESDSAVGFASATSRGTIGPLTTAGGSWLRVAGPFVGETHWRLNVTAITGDFTLAAAIGVQ